MNINNISTSPAPVEVKPVEVKPMGISPPGEPVMPAFKANKIDATEETNSTETKKQETNFSIEETKQLAEELNEFMDDLKTSLGFSIREDHRHQVIVEIKNRDTDELIKQIPSEELLAIKGKIEEFTGLIFNQKV
ncbi:flagellar protein FlaG [Desulfobacula phenolica]|uniref:Flagellar protein FlaG n=1 Tax=Desulfobacula phenolica TaxID=90732 RepID=A0A1H2DSE5_9BACT|nr:flagellar protein FlaG [Desulfobacula phenolica]SDT85714.1 flagellar protein FlaG [Desulfobacula phenolica]